MQQPKGVADVLPTLITARSDRYACRPAPEQRCDAVEAIGDDQSIRAERNANET